jgi:tagaturonate reductase
MKIKWKLGDDQMTIINRSNLSKSSLPAEVFLGSMETLPEKVIQFGDGRFIRAFVDWIINEANSKGYFRGSVVIVKNRPVGDSVERLTKQDGLFSVMIQGFEAGESVRWTNIITSVNRGINPYLEWDEYLACAENENLRFAVSNTTEVGIAYKAEAAQSGSKSTFPANLTAFLYHRYNYFQGNPARGLIVLPTELLEDNGKKLKQAVLGHAQAWQLPEEFVTWLEQHNYFLNTLVDRIVTGCSPECRAEYEEKVGIEDALMVCTEPYYLYAIEGPLHLKDEFPMAEAGLNVYWQEDITPFRVRKLRILNGSHTLLAPIALLMGQKTVRESLADEKMNIFLRHVMHEEIIPTLGLPLEETVSFAEIVTERLKNPYNNHYWEDILTGTTAKFTARVLPTLKEYVRKHHTLPQAIVFSLASLLLLYRTLVREEQEVNQFFGELWQGAHAPADIVQPALANKELWKEDLTEVEGLVTQVEDAIFMISEQGIYAALEELIATRSMKKEV